MCGSHGWISNKWKMRQFVVCVKSANSYLVEDEDLIDQRDEACSPPQPQATSVLG
jgi:hypothetical protein